MHPVGIVHHHLGDGDRLRPAVHHLNFHHPVRRQPNPLDRQLFHRREALAEDADRSDPEEHGDQGREQHQRREPLEPERHARAATGRGRRSRLRSAGRGRPGGAAARP